MAFLICGSRESAADCVQEAFVRLAHSPPPHERGSFGGYLTTVVYRLAIKEWYRQRRRIEWGKREVEDESELPGEDVFRGEEQRMAVSAIRSLDEVHRIVLVLRFYGQHSYSEIAELTHVPEGTVKSRLFYAIRECREFLKKKGVTE
jgi:RNA polymerase sigma-70 factor (ECF subfamily)